MKEKQVTEAVVGSLQAAKMLGVSVRTIQLWVEKGVLKAWKTPGGHRRITVASIEQALLKPDSGTELPTAPQNDKKPLKVLVVEDEPSVSAYNEALISMVCPGAVLLSATDGIEALLVIGRESPDVVLLDIDIPLMDGLVMLRKLNEMQIGENMQIAIVSSLSEAQIAARGGLPEGIARYQKPLPLDALESILAGSRKGER
ncbi:MAG: response regulator [Pseudomonadota bacterium]